MSARRGVLRVRNSLIACTLTAAVLFSSADAATYTYTKGVDCGDYSTVTVQNQDVWRCCSAERAKGFNFWVRPDADANAYHNVRVKILDTRQNGEYTASASSCNVKDDGATCTGESCYRPSSAYKWRCEADSCCYSSSYYFQYCLEITCEHSNAWWNFNGPCEFDYAYVVFDDAVPTSWTCSKDYYAVDDGCDCDCGAYDPDCDIAGSTTYGCNSAEHTGACTSWGTCETFQYSPPPPPSSPPPPPPPPPPSCTESTSPSADGSFGPFYCINGGTVSGLAPYCECQDCNPGFGGVNCADANACSASTDSTKTTGDDGKFWCINGGVIGGNVGGCTCTCGVGISGDHCQTRNACTASSDSEKKTGSDGTFWCINGGTIGGVTGSCTCTGCSQGYTGDHCHIATACTASSDASKTTGANGEFYCVNGGTIGGVTESCTCTGCNQGYTGDHCHTAKDCLGTRDSTKTSGVDGQYYCEHGTVSGTTGACQCKDCKTGYEGTHCQTPKICTASSDPDMTSGANGIFHCINGGTIGGVTGSCTCTGCSKGYTGDHCHIATACSASSDASKTTGADGEFYCVNGGTIGGVTESCTCTGCNPGYGGTSCATSGACSASAEASKTTGNDGVYYCINGGTISGTLGSCQCTCAGGYSGDHCQTANACTATTDESKKDGKDGVYYCINGGTIGGTSGSCQCTCAGGFEGDHCENRKMCTNTTDTTKTTGADGKFYCINGGTVGGLAESCTCTGCNEGYEGDHCQTGKTCIASSDASKTTGSDGTFYCINGGTVAGSVGSCTCTGCNTGWDGDHCQTAEACAASQDSAKNGTDGTIYCTTGGTVGGSTGSCKCTCKAGFLGEGCNYFLQGATVTKKEEAEKTRDAILSGIKDEKMKKKAKLLADAAISGKKVRKMSAKLTAPNENTACSDYYTKAGLDSKLGACVATAASRRRSLAATTYDVSVFFSEAEVDEAALTAAANSLKAEGVTGVQTTNGIDPIEELKTIEGVDASMVETFKTVASAAAATMPPSPPPPTPSKSPPPPPPPKLILDKEDDDDHAPARRGFIFVLTLTTLNFLL